jgi:antitoxin component YwqK of YwqJK toxin-antitoxin module
MRLIFILLALILTTAQANLGSLDKQGRFIYPDTNKPYTGNLDVINNDWGKDVVEINKNFVDGVLHGEERSYYQSGKLKSLGSFKSGILDGIVTGYYEGGTIQVRAIYDNGVKQGRVIHYYPNGSKQLEVFYTDDKFDGVRSTWFESGKPMEIMPYSKGLAHGTGRTYYETGGVFEETKFEYGTPKYITIYNEDGSIAEQKGWIDNKIIERIIG